MLIGATRVPFTGVTCFSSYTPLTSCHGLALSKQWMQTEKKLAQLSYARVILLHFLIFFSAPVL